MPRSRDTLRDPDDFEFLEVWRGEELLVLGSITFQVVQLERVECRMGKGVDAESESCW